MHRLPKAAAVLLASTLASAAAFTIPDGAAFRDGEALEPVTDHSIALITVEVPRSPDGRPSQSLPFRLDIFQSEEACGYANVTLDGQALPGDFTADQDHVATGSGSITTSQQAVIDATWSFHCVKINGQPQMQFLKFDIISLNGTTVEDIPFSVLFQQTGSPKVINVNTDPSVPDELAANPNPWVLVADDDDVHVPHYSVDDLDELRQQLRELEYLIAQKEQAIANHAHERFEEDIKKCHGLKCIAIAAGQKVHHAAHKTYEKIRGHDEEKVWDPFHKNDNHGKYEAWDPLHWRKPHHPLPICRFPHHEPSHPSKHRPSRPPHDKTLSSPPPPSSNANDTRLRTLLLHLAPLLILLFVFLLTMHLRAHRRTKSPSSRHQERRLRRTLRRRRPALLSRFFFPPSPNDEKKQQQQQQLATAEEGHHLHNEITELRNAANLVGSLVSSPGPEEELPEYEDKDGF